MPGTSRRALRSIHRLSLVALAASGALSLSACGSDAGPGLTGEDGGAPQGEAGPPPLADGAAPTPDGAAPPPDPCQGARYSEALPPNSASLSGITYSSANAQTYVLSVLERRYPLGKAIVTGGLANTSLGNCIDRVLRDRSTGDAVIRQLSTIVHECGHFYDLADRSASSSTYHVRPPELTFKCSQGDAQGRGGVTFARSRITRDAHASRRPACGGQSRPGCDTYADVYLDGNPDDTTFQGGDQGFNSVLEEATQYVNSLATAYAFEDRYRGTRVSERDGILTFQWYIERYLKLAKATYPQAYKLLTEDPCWRKATLTVWDRGDFYLEQTRAMQNLGIDDVAIKALVDTPELKAEIDALRALECK